MRRLKNNNFEIKKFLFFVFVLGIIKQILVSHIPIYAITTGAIDDHLMVRTANNLLTLKWLGAYDNLTLVKGPFFPFFLAVSNFIGISYIDMVTVTYTLASAIFVIAIHKIFQSKYPLYFIFLILLFNPISYSWDAVQRVYRNSITAGQVLFIFSGYFALYLRRAEPIKKLIPWALCSTLGLVTFWFTREDAIWIVPFIVVVTIIASIMILFAKPRNWKMARNKIALFFVPCIGILFFTIVISSINFMVYGVYMTNELNEGNFPKALQAMYSVKDDTPVPYVSVSRNKLEKLYEVSPTLHSIKDTFDQRYTFWSACGRNQNNGEIEDGWFFWALRESAQIEGYHIDAKTAQIFYGSIYDEIMQAINNNQLETQPTMPSALMSPWRKGYMPKILETMGEEIRYITSFDKITTELTPSVSNDQVETDYFEGLTNNKAIDSETEKQIWTVRYRQRYVDRLNFITKIYQITGTFAAVAGVLSYMIITVFYIVGIRKRDYKYQDTWLILTGILGSFLVLIGGVAYSHVSAFPSIFYPYLAGAYPLVIAFWTIAVAKLVDNLKKR